MKSSTSSHQRLEERPAGHVQEAAVHSSPNSSRRRLSRQRGQSTVEFMLMIPVLFSMYFFVIQMGLYITTINYANYAAYASARSEVGGFNNTYTSVDAVSRLIMNGLVWGSDAAASVNGATGARVALTGFERRVPLPFISGLVPSMDFAVSVRLGPKERNYEGVEGRPSDQYDNNTVIR